MPSSNQLREYVLEQLASLGNIKSKQMMGEFLLYYNDTLFGGIYDNRLLIKKSKSNGVYCLTEDIPYPQAKPMYLVDNLDDPQYLCDLIITTCNDLKKTQAKNKNS